MDFKIWRVALSGEICRGKYQWCFFPCSDSWGGHELLSYFLKESQEEDIASVWFGMMPYFIRHDTTTVRCRVAYVKRTTTFKDKFPRYNFYTNTSSAYEFVFSLIWHLLLLLNWVFLFLWQNGGNIMFLLYRMQLVKLLQNYRVPQIS